MTRLNRLLFETVSPAALMVAHDQGALLAKSPESFYKACATPVFVPTGYTEETAE